MTDHTALIDSLYIIVTNPETNPDDRAAVMEAIEALETQSHRESE